MQNTDPILSIPVNQPSMSADQSGDWNGTVRVLFCEVPAHATFMKTVHGWNGTVSIDNFDLINSAASKIHFTENSFYFEVKSNDGVLTFDGVFLNGKMIGNIHRSGCNYTFVLEKSSSPAPSF